MANDTVLPGNETVVLRGTDGNTVSAMLKYANEDIKGYADDGIGDINMSYFIKTLEIPIHIVEESKQRDVFNSAFEAALGHPPTTFVQGFLINTKPSITFEKITNSKYSIAYTRTLELNKKIYYQFILRNDDEKSVKALFRSKETNIWYLSQHKPLLWSKKSADLSIQYPIEKGRLAEIMCVTDTELDNAITNAWEKYIANQDKFIASDPEVQLGAYHSIRYDKSNSCYVIMENTYSINKFGTPKENPTILGYIYVDNDKYYLYLESDITCDKTVSMGGYRRKTKRRKTKRRKTAKRSPPKRRYRKY